MADGEYDLVDFPPKIPSQVNPCYDVVSCKPKLDTATSTQVNSKAKKSSRDWCLLIGFILVVVVACVSMAVALWSIAKVNSFVNASAQNSIRPTPDEVDELNSSIINAVEILRNEIVLVRNFSVGSLEEVNTSIFDALGLIQRNLSSVLSGVSDNLNSTFLINSLEEVNTSIFNAVDTILNSGVIAAYAAISCLDLFHNNPSTPPGYYWIRASNGSAVRVYCDMTRSCGGVTGGWMRVANLDFSEDATLCPSGLRERTDSGIRTCGIQSSSAACASVLFDTNGIAYSKVCGMVNAYYAGKPDAFGDFGTVRGSNSSIDSNYVDGVSLTYGSSPRKHIWTFAAAFDEYGANTESICECSNSGRAGGAPPGYVAMDYFCDSKPGRQRQSVGTFFSSSPMWDGSGCGPDSTCCSFNNPPWFYKQLPSPTSDAIEMRVCSDEVRDNEDIPMSSVQIYVRF